MAEMDAVVKKGEDHLIAYAYEQTGSGGLKIAHRSIDRQIKIMQN
ncbi:hypothetical protein [Sodalis sp. C49]